MCAEGRGRRPGGQTSTTIGDMVKDASVGLFLLKEYVNKWVLKLLGEPILQLLSCSFCVFDQL